jgi:hypothetical protein
MQKQMHVRVDEAGQQRGVAEVDDLGALRMVDRNVPTALMRSPSTRISPGWRMFPVSTWSSRAACSTMGAVAGCWAGEPTPATTKMTAPKVGANRKIA